MRRFDDDDSSIALKELRSIVLATLTELARIYQYDLQEPHEALPIYESVIAGLSEGISLPQASSFATIPLFKTPKVVVLEQQEQQNIGKASSDRLVFQLVRALYDAAVCHTMVDSSVGHLRAIGVYETALELLTSSTTNGHAISGRVRLNFARSLRAVDLVDRALEQYITVESILVAHGNRPQISENGSSALLSLGELNAHLGHCLHYNIGDLVRAEKYYTRALNLSGIDELAKSIFERIRRPPHDLNSAYEGGSDAAAVAGDEEDVDRTVATVPSVNPFPSVVMRLDVACWVCESYAQLLLRIGDNEQAKRILQWRVSVGMLHADACIPAYLSLIHALDQLREHEAVSEIFYRLLQLPTGSMTTTTRFEIVTRYAYHCHYTLQDYEKASALYSIALELDATKPQLLSQYASCLCYCPCANEVDVTPLVNGRCASSDDNPATTAISGIDAIRALYVRALELTEIRVQDAMHHASIPDSSTESKTLDFEPAFVYADCAVFFHDKAKDPATAAQLYEKVWEHAGDKPHLVEIVAQSKANYAQLLYFDLNNRVDAEKYYREAMELCGTFNIHSSYIDFLVATSQEAEALSQLTKMSEAFPGHAAQIYHRIARLEDKADNGNTSVDNLDERLRLYCIANGAASDVKEISAEYILTLLEHHANDINAATDLVSFIHGRMHNFPLAKQCYQILVPKFPNGATLLANYARFCSDQLHKPALAKKYLVRAMQRSPSDMQLVELLSELLAVHFPDEMATAEGMMHAAVRQHPENAAAHQAYAMFLTTHVGSPQAADAEFHIAMRLKPKDAALRAIYAAFLERQFYATTTTAMSASGHKVADAGDDEILKQTMKLFDEAEAIDAECGTVHFLRGVSLAKRHSLSEAWIAYQTALSLEPNNPQFVKVAATFVHDRYVTISNSIVLAGRTAAPYEGTQLINLASLADALYCKAIRLEGGQDSTLLFSYSRFQDEVLQRPIEARKTSDLAVSAVKRAEEVAVKKLAPEETDPDDLLR